MMTAEQLHDLSLGIRARQKKAPPPGGPEVTDELVGRIEADVAEYRTFRTDDPPPEPPEPLRDRLPLMGWLIYEASLDRLWNVKAQFETLAGADGVSSRANADLIRRLANAGRQLVWPQFAPRWLGALRAEALVESKRDTEAGYDAAYILHVEARDRHQSYRDALGGNPIALDEVLIQLALAETGTACRTAERVIGRWDQEFRRDEPELEARNSERWTQRIFRDLTEAVTIGAQALAGGRRIKEDPNLGLVDDVTAERLTIKTALRNPAIMTCRAILLAYSLCPQMRRLGRTQPSEDSWEKYQESLLEQFDDAFPALLLPITNRDGQPWPLNDEHRRALVQICLHLALLTARHVLFEPVVVDETLTLHVLSDDCVERMSAWLATKVDGKQRGDANVIGSASKPDFVASVEACRVDSGAAADYRAWRLRWFELDRYAAEPGRYERIARILTPG